MKTLNKKEAAPAKTGSRYTELKQMLDDRRRELQAEVQGKMRDVREEGTWGGKLNEVLDAVESSEADIQEDIEFALDPDEVRDAQQDQRRARRGSSRATTATASSAARKSRRSACARCPSRSAARTAKRRARPPSSASVSWPRGAARRRSSSTCKTPASHDGAPPVAEPDPSPPASPILACIRHPVRRSGPHRTERRSR